MTQMNLPTKQKQTHRHREQTCGCQGRGGGGWIGSLGLVDANYYLWMDNKVLLHSTGNYIQCPGINHNRKEYKKECVYICITESLCCTEINTL